MLTFAVFFAMPRGAAYRRGILLSTLIVEGGLALLAQVLGWLLDFDIWARFTWSWADIGWGCLAAGPPLFIVWLMNVYPVGWLRKVREITDDFLRPLLRPLRWPDFIIMSALAGFGEELLFRGWLQPYLDQFVPVWASIMLVGLVFGLLHPITVAYVVIAFFISLYFSGLLLWSGNLLVPMVAHGVYDFIALIGVTWNDETEKDGRPGGESPVPDVRGGGEEGEQAEEFPEGLPAGEAGGGNLGTLSAWRTGTPGEGATGPEGACSICEVGFLICD